MRISCIRGGLVIYNCRPFDPAEASKTSDPDGVCSGTGIKLIDKISRIMDYRNTLGQNMLMIVV